MATEPKVRKLAVISSFQPSHGIERSLHYYSEWTRKFGVPIACDVYAFMQSDLSLFNDCLSISDLNAVEWLAQLQRQEAVSNGIECVARKLARWCSKAGVQVGSVSTYIPEIGGSESDSHVATGRDALSCILRIVKYLRRDEYGAHPIRVVEVVGGSLIRGSFTAGNRQTSFRIGTSHVSTALREIAQSYVCALKNAGVRDDEDIVLACELEPGVLFALNSKERLIEFLEVVDNLNDNVITPYKHIALNADLAHWMLAGIRLDDDEVKTKLFPRVVHVHVSGHDSRSHFGDISMEHLSDETLRHWKNAIDLLSRLPRSSGLPQFDDTLSVEFECCSDVPNLVENSIRTAMKLRG